MAETTEAVDERQESPAPVDHMNADSTSRSPSRQLSPETSVDLHKAPDASERPVREQLKNTSITNSDSVPSTAEQAKIDDALSEVGSVGSDARKSDDDAETCSNRGRPRRKRSFEELDVDHVDGRTGTSGSKHIRKRSRGDKDDGLGKTGSQDSTARVELHGKTDVKQSPDPQEVAAAKSDDGPSERPVTPPAGLGYAVHPAEEMAISPQNKRNRDQFVKDHDATLEKAPLDENNAEATVKANMGNETLSISKAAADEPYSKRPRDGTVPQADGKQPSAISKIPSSSGFSNTSTQSPFSALASPPAPSSQPQTSSSAFASSGFASFAGTTQSPFGTVGSKTTAAEDMKDKVEATKPDSAPTSGFGSLGGAGPSPFAAATPSVFGSGSSGFAKLSNGFGSGGNFGIKPLSNFASPSGSGIIGISSKTSKPIGASADEEDDEEAEANEEERENGDTAPKSVENDEKDSRFFEQDVETGEEGEETVFNSRAKLYVSQEKQWKERGVGTFKVNVAYYSENDDDSDTPPKKSARFIMRADGSHRIVLNSPIKKEITIDDPTGGPPKGKTAIFLGFIDDKPTMMQLKMRSNVQTEELHNVVTALRETL